MREVGYEKRRERKPGHSIGVGVKRGGKKGEVGTVGKGGHGSV